MDMGRIMSRGSYSQLQKISLNQAWILIRHPDFRKLYSSTLLPPLLQQGFDSPKFCHRVECLEFLFFMVTKAKYAPAMVARVAGRPTPRASLSLELNPALLLFIGLEGAVGLDALETPFAVEEAAASALEEDDNRDE